MNSCQICKSPQIISRLILQGVARRVADLVGAGAQEGQQECNAICFHIRAPSCLGVMHQGWEHDALQEGRPAHQLLKQLPTTVCVCISKRLSVTGSSFNLSLPSAPFLLGGQYWLALSFASTRFGEADCANPELGCMHETGSNIQSNSVNCREGGLAH